MSSLAEAIPPGKWRASSCGIREPDVTYRESLQPRVPHLSESERSLAMARAGATNILRLAIAIAFAMALLLVRAIGTPVPDMALVTYACYVTILGLYQRFLRGALSRRWLDNLQTAAFLLDVTFVAGTFFAFGGVWWLGPAIYMLVVTGAFGVLRRRRAWIVTVYAAIVFSGGILLQATGIGPSRSILGASALAGDAMLAYAAALFGSIALLSAAYIQGAFAGVVRRGEKRFRLIVKTANEWIVTADESGRITSANDATRLLAAPDGRDVIGLRFVELIHEDNRVEVEEAIRATVADGGGRSFEARYSSADGEIHTLLCDCNRLTDETSSLEVVIVARDITQGVRDREAIKAREALLAETEKLAHIGSWEWDVGTDTMRWSDELYRMFGVEPGPPVTSADFMSQVHPDDIGMVRATIMRSIESGEPLAFEHRLVGGNGSARVVQFVGRVIPGAAGSPPRIVGSEQDITERNALTEQLRQAQKMEALGRLAGGIAHDFNNVLTIIKTYGEFLHENLADRPSDRADVEEIGKATEKAADLTRQLLVFSRRQDAELQTVDLNRSVESLESMLQRLVGADIEISTRLDEDIWCVRADVGQIEQLLMNLVVNACDAMPNGGSLRIETANAVIASSGGTHDDSPEGRFAMLTVSDTGQGMTPVTKARIFDPFFTTKEVGKGTGLGLSIVYGIVRQSAGHVECESEVGRGTTFRIYLPRVDSDIEVKARTVAVAGTRRGTETILLVEDKDEVRTAVSRTLREAGYRVIEAANGVGGIAILRSTSEHVDMIVTDMSMPGMGGGELATAVRLRNATMPILFMSGYTEETPDVSGERPAGGILRKPFTNDALLSRVRALLDPGGDSGSESSVPPGTEK